MKKFVLYTTLLVLSSYFLINTLRVLSHLYQVEKKMGETKAELTQIEKENEDLKNKLTEVRSNYFVEKEARDKFLMKKAGEDVLVVRPPASLKKDLQEDLNLPNWKKWYKLILGG